MEIIMIKRMLFALIGVFVLIGLTGFQPASATTTDNREENIGTVVYSAASFAASGAAAAKQAVKATSKGKILLSVSVKGIPKKQIKKCWKEKPGKWVWNEGLKPGNGKRSAGRWQVRKGDNTFCTKKGKGSRVFKKSCNNEIWGLKGTRKVPTVPRIKGKVTFQNYLSYAGKVSVTSTQKGSASAYAAQYQDGKKVCEASSIVSGSSSAKSWAVVRVKARSTTNIAIKAARAARIKIANSTKIRGDLRVGVHTSIEGKVAAWCNVPTPPPTTPPPPVVPKPKLLEITTVNDVLVNNTRTIAVVGNTAPGHTGTLFCTARNGGTITAGKSQSVSSNFSKQITYKAPDEVPAANSEYNIAAGRDRVDCTVTQDDGQTATISTNQFEIRPAPVDPL